MAGPRTIGFEVPALTCDSHAHVFGPLDRYPANPTRVYDPPAHANLENYRRLHANLGITRGVLVQPSPYATDNSCLVDALRALGPGYRGVGVFRPDVSDPELDRMDAAGIRGVRIQPGQGLPFELIEPLAKRIAGRGWHLQIFPPATADIATLAPRVRALPVPPVFDHMGRLPAARGMNDAGFQALLKLVGEGHAWVKVSWAETLSAKGSPYDDVDPQATALIRANPDRVVWGTDWPHGYDTRQDCDEVELLSLIGRWAPDPAVRNKILVDNPARLYGFR